MKNGDNATTLIIVITYNLISSNKELHRFLNVAWSILVSTDETKLST